MDAEYKSWDDTTEVKGQMITTFINAMGPIKTLALDALSEKGSSQITEEEWYPLQNFLYALKMVEYKFGPNTLYVTGQKIPGFIDFPEDVKSIDDAIAKLNELFQSYHRGNEEEMGFSYNKLSRNAANIECRRTYGTQFDRGLITGLGSRYKPKRSKGISVELDKTKPNRQKGNDSHTFTLKW